MLHMWSSSLSTLRGLGFTFLVDPGAAPVNHSLCIRTRMCFQNNHTDGNISRYSCLNIYSLVTLCAVFNPDLMCAEIQSNTNLA